MVLQMVGSFGNQSALSMARSSAMNIVCDTVFVNFLQFLEDLVNIITEVRNGNIAVP